jgi:hypothetical protein
MKLEFQIRRGVFGFVAFAALGLVAAAHGGPVTERSVVLDAGLAQCDVIALPAAPIADRGDGHDARRADWRDLLPAMIFRTRD